MNRITKRVTKLLTLAAASLLILANAATVSAKPLAGAKVTYRAKQVTASAGSSQKQSTSSGSSQTSPAASQVSSSAGGGTSARSTALSSNAAKVNTTTTASVQTGYFEDNLPLFISIAVSLVLVFAFGTLRLRLIRSGRRSQYRDEMEAFRRSCRE